MRKLRIGFVADVLGAPIGGGVTSGRRFVDALRREHEVVEIGADAEGPGRLRGFQLPLRAMREMQFTMAWPRRDTLEHALAEVDVVHLQFPFYLSFEALEVARQLGKPVVAAFHVQPENALYNVGIRSPRLMDRVYRLWIERLYNRVDAVICPTEFARRKLVERGLQSPTLVISNGVPTDLVPAPRVPRSDGKFHLLMAGRLAAEKRQEDLLRAIARSRHRERIRVQIAGTGPRRAPLERLARALEVDASFGFLPREELIRSFRDADVFVHCSEVELEGIAVIEAMSMGLPVLVADAPESAAAELALGEAFRFRARDPADLAAKLDALLEQPAVLEAARESAKVVARSLDFGVTVSAALELYLELVEAREADDRAGALAARPSEPAQP